MQLDVRHNIAEVSRWLDDAQRKQVPFASVLAMTMTAKQVQQEEIGVMRRVFDRPTPYALNALKVKPATKATMLAKVEFREFGGGTPAKRFLNPNVHGGARSQKSHEVQLASLLRGYSYLVPARDVARNAYGNVKGGFFTRVLSQLKVSRDPMQNATDSKRSRAKRAKSAFFIPKTGDMVMERTGKGVKPVLIGVRVPQYRKRFPFYETASRIVKERIGINFEIAFQRAMATARTPR